MHRPAAGRSSSGRCRVTTISATKGHEDPSIINDLIGAAIQRIDVTLKRGTAGFGFGLSDISVRHHCTLR
jgi:hypothetical protein